MFEQPSICLHYARALWLGRRSSLAFGKSVWRIRTGTAGTGHEDALRLNASVGFESGPLLPMIDGGGF
jgi:hypothetical protein